VTKFAAAFAVAAGLAGGASLFFDGHGAFAQGKIVTGKTTECEPGFMRRAYPHGSEFDFVCLTRVVDCPERSGYQWAIVPDATRETAAGVQFVYRCLYTRSSKDR
jgi:hypothetical protein